MTGLSGDVWTSLIAAMNGGNTQLQNLATSLTSGSNFRSVLCGVIEPVMAIIASASSGPAPGRGISSDGVQQGLPEVSNPNLVLSVSVGAGYSLTGFTAGAVAFEVAYTTSGP